MLSTGGVKCWGYNFYGQLGDGTNTDRWRPADVSGLISGVVEVSSGDDHTCALTSRGTVKCWGLDNYGQLGNGATGGPSYVPVDVVGLPSGVVAIAAGASHTCALTGSGGVMCWGSNAQGQLGDGATTDSSAPVAVRGLSSGVRAVVAGMVHSCALLSSGSVTCWGYNAEGELGDGTTGSSTTPVNVLGLAHSAVAVSSSTGRQTCALEISGGVQCWGANFSGELGDGTTTSSPTPVDVVGLTGGAIAISAGEDHSCAVTSAGAAKCWGNNGFGSLGNDSNTNSSVPVDVSGLSSGVASISAGGGHTCAVTGASVLKCWGENFWGQVGDGSTSTAFIPVTVAFNPPDTTAPTITLTTPPVSAQYPLGQPVIADYSCADEVGGSGLASCVGTVMSGTTIVGTVTSGTAIDTSILGSFSFTVDAYDNAGHHAQTTHNYTVVAPTFGVASVTPSSVGRGVNLTTLTVLGSAFTSGSTVAILGGSGYSIIGGTTFVDSGHLTVNVSVGNNATLGAHDVRVTRPSGGGSVICAGCLTINPKPTITTVVPPSAHQGTTRDVVINGTGFAPGALVSFSGTGITVNSVSGSGRRCR